VVLFFATLKPDQKEAKQMTKFRELFPGIWLGPQPANEDLSELEGQGVEAVIDFRMPSETLSSNAELTKRHGFSYINIPLSRDNPDPDAVEELDQALNNQPGPYLLHCGSGIRAITIYLLREAKRQGWSAEQVENEAKERGFDLTGAPGLLRLTRDYLA
jgi:uncharacterized protein (TIGR01244 family)